MALNKSPIQQLLDAFKSHGAISFQLWMEENQQGWEMNADWPEHGVIYYDENYGKAI